ncbi:acetyl-CoA carboxylase, carboxyltransferase subunit beta [Azospirillum sp. CT11-132]|jgi:acetyl-CoA carboxylase carboxyl transferase subunit beta|uniref:acetyl-CoA carboxylase, carboxyltransferase subunit beta n=1 Tax=unclassified Azospirillum TaxID=2630922 RepID=UPI000D622A85|nr:MULTISPECIES: acetyl-CoA carboxylase, carboxyltransferase subunit beta [unclassified Azospirillum]PWC69484.1 acetyl-CoA carboxyl transferase [Azospirillum sp. TSH7]PWC71976.1 acetyl-CoA carboxyl transferase [Azospirillum sp. TSH20]QCG97684.1 acetyl-CoA carboxylase carboxyltransferase subunit beta [Azospirillum sp. TSA2s]
MNWLTNYVRPKIRALYARKEVPDNLWHKCPSCESMLFHRELEENLHVCQHCGFHMRLDPVKRLESMFDDGAYEGVELPKSVADPLKFRDQKRYTDRLKEAQTKTGRTDAIVVGEGRIGGHAAVVAAFDFGFMGGSMGIAVGEGLLTAARLAVAKNAPLIVVPASGGARMQEGILSLMQMPRTTIAVEMVKEAGLPYIVVLTDPTTGGVTASFAMLGDIHIAEKGAQIGFAGARVIESTIRETLPEGFQRSEYLMEHGMVDMVVHRRDLRPTLVRTIGLLMTPRLDAVAEDIDLSAAQAADGEPAQLPQSATQPVTQPATQATAAQPAATQQASSQPAAPVQAGDD